MYWELNFRTKRKVKMNNYLYFDEITKRNFSCGDWVSSHKNHMPLKSLIVKNGLILTLHRAVNRFNLPGSEVGVFDESGNLIDNSTMENMKFVDLELPHDVDFQEKDRTNFLKTITLSYKKAPLYDDFYPVLEDVILNYEDDLTLFLKYSFEKVKELQAKGGIGG